ncbi:outer membrane usher protein [Kluyvera cryocrescens]|uniref:outer membrane usher protein n=1 Tax=Kluyvera cryocrescens TaxID=580 RepID=UPI002DBDDE14|nr:outer membrane usher protein [Kluyvera cryocrescens]MEB7712033.1 outer membrane usher protein [Kluyvera cryocrescens]HDG1686630.1 outer membrane usher protein [Kluyvera cryocrescens]
MDCTTSRWRLLLITLACYPILSSAQEEVEFNSNFLMGSNKIDTSRYAKGNPVSPGEYQVQIYLNNKQIVNELNLEFQDNGTAQAEPCLKPSLLERLEVDSEKAVIPIPADEQCLGDLAHYFPGSSVSYDPLNLRLDVVMPQVFLQQIPVGTVPPSRWENGIPALLLAYDTNYYHQVSSTRDSDTAYAGLTYGANLGPWRLRARGSLNWDSDDDDIGYDSQDIYLQRDIAPLRAQMILGDSSTKGDAFDTLKVRGLRLYTDKRMYSSSVNNYAPIIRGVANSNAKVTVKQNGSTIYQTTVPPGPFTLSDVIPSGYGNDLDVTVEEADGSKTTFTVAYSSVPQLIRKGYGRWEVAAGELHDNSLNHKPKVAQLTGYYGLSDTITGYGGLQASDQSYYAVLGGLAFNTPLGAIATDITHSQAEFDDTAQDHQSGESYRVTYSSLVSATQTTFSLAAYRFSTKGYLTLKDAASLNDDLHDGSLENLGDYQRLRDQLQLNINQPLRWGGEDHGSFYLSGSWETYWGGYADTQQYSVGYSNNWKALNYSISAQRSYDNEGKKDDSVFINFTLPFSAFTHDNHKPGGFTTLSGGISNSGHGSTQFNANASGATADNKFSYSVNAATGIGGGDNSTTSSVGTYLTWNSPYGPFNASASATDGEGSQYSLSNSGGVIVHSGGVTFAPDSIGSDSAIALVRADGAEGAKLTMGDGEIGRSGYGMSTYLSPYRENRIGLNIEGMDNDVEIKSTSTTVVPTSGAVVGVNFETDQGRPVLLMLIRGDGGDIPLGAAVRNEKGDDVGNVGQAGYAYVRGIEDVGTLQVVWGAKTNEMCQVSYRIPTDRQMADKTIVLSGQRCVMKTGTPTSLGGVR